MKILRLSTFLDFGGVETRLANISHVQDDHEWLFVCINREGKAAQIIKDNNKRVLNLQSSPSIYSFKTFFKLYQVLKKEKPDVIHTSGAEANFHGILAAKLAGVPRIIGEEIGTPNHSKKAQFLFSKIYKLANFVVGNADSVLKVVHEIDKVPNAKLVKIENPIIFKELPVVSKLNEDSNDFKIIMISRLESVKNIEGALNVIARFISDGKSIELTIAGTGSLEVHLKNLVEKLGLEKHVDFVGFITEPYSYLLNSDLYILNSFTEGFSNSLIEAMYSKTPSLSTAVGSAPEIIVDCENGFLIPPNDELALYEKIAIIMKLPKEARFAIGKKGSAMVIENFSLEIHIGKLLKIYN